MSGLLEKAERLRALHRGSRPLVLANVWDAASARIVARAGFPAIATTSAGIAFSFGYPDGERIPRERMLEAVSLICSAVAVPVTADMEAGYGDSPEEMEATAKGVLDAGAIGMNIEDGTRDPARPLADLSLQLDKIRAVRGAAQSRGVPLVLNARTDAYLRGVGAAKEQFVESVRRGEAYRDAGADCVFVPGLIDAATIGRLVRELGCPINVLAGPGCPSIDELATLGVARVSLGSGPMRASVTLLRRLAEELRTEGTYSALEGLISHTEMNELMS